MAFEIEWLERARQELDSEVAYVLEEYGFVAARKAFLRVQQYVSNLTVFPLTGTVYPGVTYHGCEVRKLTIRQVTVYYSPQADKVTILALWNNYQNPDRIDYRLLEVDD